MIKVLAFDTQVHNLSELEKMSDKQKLDLAEMCMMLGDDDVGVATLEEFQKYFNDGDVSPEWQYIFFVETE